MRELTGILVIVAIVGSVLAIMISMSRQEEKLRAGAQKLLDERATVKSQPASFGEVVFHKSRLSGFIFLGMLLLLVPFVCDLTYFDGSLHTKLRSLTGFQFSGLILICLLPLSFAFRIFRYRVSVSDHALTITDLSTRSVPLHIISDVRIGTSRATSFCRIGLMTGEEDIAVGSDLERFPEFVKLLCERVNALKVDGGPSPMRA
jgi:hypothetical protein